VKVPLVAVSDDKITAKFAEIFILLVVAALAKVLSKESRIHNYIKVPVQPQPEYISTQGDSKTIEPKTAYPNPIAY
jgi:hypothetical protein